MRCPRSYTGRGTISGLALGLAFAVTMHASTARADRADECASAAEEAQTLRAQAKLQQARTRLLACASETCPAVVRRDCLSWLAEIDKAQPTVILRARDSRDHDVAKVRVTIDGAPIAAGLAGTAIPVDPGPHRFRAEAASGAVVDTTVVVVESEKARVVTLAFDVPLRDDGTADVVQPPAPQVSPAPAESPLPPSSAPSRSLVPAFVAAGVGVAALGVFGYFEGIGQSDYASMKDGCGQTHTCKPSDVDALQTKFITAGISLGVGVVAAGVATWLFLSGSAKTDAPSSSARAPSFGVSIVPQGGVATYGASF